MGASYLDLLGRIATEQGHELAFHGLQVETTRSISAFVRTNNVDAARDAADEAAPYVSGEERAASAGIEPLARQVSAAVRDLGATAEVIIGPWKRAIMPRGEREPVVRDEILAARATVLRVGGAVPAVRLEALGEHFPFTLKIEDKSWTPKLGAHIYREVDIVASIRRDADDKIIGGTLDEYTVVEEGSGVDAWREWFQRSCSGWGDVDDVLRELGRDEGGDVQ